MIYAKWFSRAEFRIHFRQMNDDVDDQEKNWTGRTHRFHADWCVIASFTTIRLTNYAIQPDVKAPLRQVFGTTLWIRLRHIHCSFSIVVDQSSRSSLVFPESCVMFNLAFKQLCSRSNGCRPLLCRHVCSIFGFYCIVLDYLVTVLSMHSKTKSFFGEIIRKQLGARVCVTRRCS